MYVDKLRKDNGIFDGENASEILVSMGFVDNLKEVLYPFLVAIYHLFCEVERGWGFVFCEPPFVLGMVNTGQLCFRKILNLSHTSRSFFRYKVITLNLDLKFVKNL